MKIRRVKSSEAEVPERVERETEKRGPKRGAVSFFFFGFPNTDVDQTIVCKRGALHVGATGGNTSDEVQTCLEGQG